MANWEQLESTEDIEQIEEDLKHIISCEGLTFVEIKSAIGSRSDLGRPTSTPQENKEIFMKFLTE